MLTRFALLLAGCFTLQEKILSKEAQAAQLDARTDTRVFNGGTMDKFCELAWTFRDVNICSDLKEIGKIQLTCPFPAAYEPTWREVFETVGRQTQTSWKYSIKHGGWLFDKPALPPVFTFDLAKGWKQEDRGFYTFCQPPDMPVGMDIYHLGTYSFEKEADKELLKIRDACAVNFAKGIKPDVKLEEMKKTEIDGCEALFLETPAPKEKVMWRQWVFAKGGRAIAIVSALDEGKDALLKDVKAMAASFKFVKEPKK